MQSEDFFSLIEAHEGKPVKLLVYSTLTDVCREVVVTPNGAWGGEGRYGKLQWTKDGCSYCCVTHGFMGSTYVPSNIFEPGVEVIIQTGFLSNLILERVQEDGRCLCHLKKTFPGLQVIAFHG